MSSMFNSATLSASSETQMPRVLDADAVCSTHGTLFLRLSIAHNARHSAVQRRVGSKPAARAHLQALSDLQYVWFTPIHNLDKASSTRQVRWSDTVRTPFGSH